MSGDLDFWKKERFSKVSKKKSQFSEIPIPPPCRLFERVNLRDFSQTDRHPGHEKKKKKKSEKLKNSCADNNCI